MDSSRATRRRIAILAAAIVGATSWHSWATAQTSISLPTLSSCKSAVSPTLPKRWHAVGLMSPFLEGQLDIGDFVYDAAVPAMRATVYGLESGAADLLITDAHTYQLFGAYGAPTIGDYAMTYFPTFTELPQTNLSQLRDFCASRAKKAPAETDGADTARALMAIPNEAAEGERHDRIGTLIPGLSHQPCAHAKTPNWPERFATTAFLTPISFGDDPYATLILYDWSETASQFAVMFQNTPPAMKALVALKKNVGYRIYPYVSGPICEPVYPGLVRPDWMKVAWCQCKGVIDHNPALSPNDVTQILSCPIKWQNRRIMWSWYTANDRPVVFVEAGARGDGGVLLADYDRWLPGEKVTAKNFDLPNTCPAPDKSIRPPAHGNSLANNSCTDCHTTPW